MANLTRPDEALALRTTLLCGLVVVLEGYDLSTLQLALARLATGSRSVVGSRCASRWYPMSVHRAGKALSSS